jgi:hypothetical protein
MEEKRRRFKSARVMDVRKTKKRMMFEQERIFFVELIFENELTDMWKQSMLVVAFTVKYEGKTEKDDILTFIRMKDCRDLCAALDKDKERIHQLKNFVKEHGQLFVNRQVSIGPDDIKDVKQLVVVASYELVF